jgi:uncharacterized linocin/CFP29 family protein
MNIQEMMNEITNKHAKHAADLMDGTAYAYVTKQMEALQAAGADLTEYEVVIATEQYPRLLKEKDGASYRVSQRIVLMRSKDLPTLPIDESALVGE